MCSCVQTAYQIGFAAARCQNQTRGQQRARLVAREIGGEPGERHRGRIRHASNPTPTDRHAAETAENTKGNSPAGARHDWQHLAAAPRWKHHHTANGASYYWRNSPPKGPPIKAWQIKTLDPATRKTALAWLGGKTPYNPGGTGRWLQTIIPADAATYAEPYAGMLGQMLARPPAKLEIANDRHKIITNWWQQVRDHNEQLTALLELTPYDENAYNQIKQTDWNSQSKLWQAWAFTVICDQSFGGQNDGTFSRHYDLRSAHGGIYPDQLAAKVRKLRDRIANIQIYNQPATHFLDRLAPRTDTVIYCDPPYYSAADNYRERGYNVDELTTALQQQAGRTMISGYPGEWDHLGWNYLDRHRTTTTSRTAQPERTERIWANYPLTDQRLGFDYD